MLRTTQSSSPQALPTLIAFFFAAALTGCGGAYNSGGTSQMPPPTTATGATIVGTVHQGNHTITGARVYLFGVNTTGYGSPSVSLLTAASTGQSDSLGAYVSTDGSGTFAIRGDYACPSTAQTYLYTAGGSNPASGLIAALGPCPDPSNTTSPRSVWINEVTTVAAAYALAGFATDATHMASSNTPLARTGVANAMLNAANLVNPSTGVALAVTPDGNGSVPQAELNTLGNMLAACGRSNGANTSECSTLFTAASNTAGVPASDIATAAINIAHAPANAVANLYGLASIGPEFAPRLTSVPADYTLALSFTHPGLPSNGNLTIAVDGSGNLWIPNESSTTITKLSSTGKILSGGGFTAQGLTTHPVAVAMDGSGNAWVPNNSASPVVVELSNSGTALGASAGFTDSSLKNPLAIALDSSGAAWVANADGPSLTKFSPSGAVASPLGGYTGGGLQHPVAIAIDGAGNVWASNLGNDSISKFTAAGTPLSPVGGFTGGGLSGPQSIAVDSSDSIWISNYMNNSITRLSDAGAPAAASGFTGGGLFKPVSIAIDGAGTAWIANEFGSVSHLSTTGAAISPPAGYVISGPPVVIDALALDGSGDVWLSADSAVVELIGASVPVVTPLPFGIANNALGTRP